jgi:NAD-dependent glycerol-3-phosphate dehydrogenase C-terminus
MFSLRQLSHHDSPRRQTSRRSCSVPQAVISRSFSHLVGTGKQRRRDCERRAAPRPGRVADEILKQLGHVAEGVYFAPAIEALAAEKRVDMPITRAVCAVLFRGTPPRDAVREPLALDPRDRKSEIQKPQPSRQSRCQHQNLPR